MHTDNLSIVAQSSDPPELISGLVYSGAIPQLCSFVDVKIYNN